MGYICPVKYSWEPPEIALSLDGCPRRPWSLEAADSLSCSPTTWAAAWVAGLFLVPSCSCLRLRRWDCNLEPQRRPLCNACGAYNPFSTEKLHPNSLQELLGSTWTFLSSTQEKKSTKRTSLGTNKGTSLGFYPKVKRKKKKASTQ